MIGSLQELAERVSELKREIVAITSRYGGSRSRVWVLDDARKRLHGLSLQQDELLQQALSCVEHGLYRAAHVMAWTAFIDFLEQKLGSDGFTKVRSARPPWGRFKTLVDLRENIPEYQLIEVARDVGFLSKTEKKTLEGLLSKRNECAHPGDYTPTSNEALGYVAEVLNRIELLQGRTI